MEDVTLGLGGILGESTNLKPLNDRPFTKAAQQELSLGLKAKADEAKLAKEKEKVDREYANIIKPPANVDKIAADRIKQITINGLQSGRFKTQMGAMLGQQELNREQEYSDQYREMVKGLDKTLVRPEVADAFKRGDQEALIKFTQDPKNNVVYDEQSGRVILAKHFPKIDLNDEIGKELKFGNDVVLDKSTTKSYKDANGHLHSAVRIDPNLIDFKIKSLAADDNIAQNFYFQNEKEIDAELPKVNGDWHKAIESVMKKKLDPLFWVKEDVRDIPRPSSGGRYGDYQVNIGGGGKESNGILMTPDPDKKGFVNVKKKAEKGKETEVLRATILDENGESHDFGKVEGYYKIGNNKYRVIGSLKSGENTVEVDVPNVTSTQLAKSIGVSKDALDEMGVTFEYDKEKKAREKAVADFNKKHGTEHSITRFFKADPNITEYIAYKPTETSANYGKRNDGVTEKGNGYFGEVKLPNGGIATEYTTQSDAVKVNGKRIDFPTLVPTLTKQELDLMANDIIPNKKDIPESIMQKAIQHAKKRIGEGKSVYADKKAEASKKKESPQERAARIAAGG